MDGLLLTYNNLLSTNPVVAGLIPVWIATVSTLLLRGVPAFLWGIIRTQSTTTLNLLSTGAGSADMQYFSFLNWFVKRGFMKYSRSLSVESAWSRDCHGTVLPGNGTHYFIWHGRLCWLYKSRVEQSGTTHEITHQISVGMIGRNQLLLNQMVDEFRWRPDTNRGHLFYPNKEGTGWSSSHRVTERKLDTIVLNAGIKEELVQAIEWFLHNREWYLDRGFPYRMTLLLEGPPGTGKSSLLRALTGHFKRNLCPINLSSCTDISLPELLRTAPMDSFILMEDFDDCPAVLAPEFRESKSDDGLLATVMASRLSRSVFLQAMDGVDVIDGQVVILTTNHIEKIDEAVKRDERVNHRFHLGLLQNEAIHRYIETVFPNTCEHKAFIYAPVSGASLQKAYRKHHLSYRDFLGAIPVVNPDVVSESQEETV
jgi:hypothetical protein